MGMRHFDVQMIGGIVLHEGKIAEMRTGEGKTLVATLAVYLNAIPANGVHVVTVNDYLAQRDAEWMRPLYEGLGLSVGIILSGQDGAIKQEALALFSPISLPLRNCSPTDPILLTAPTMSSVSIICAPIWPLLLRTEFSASLTLR